MIDKTQNITDRVLFKDRQCIVMNKESGELCRGSGKSQGNLHHSVMAYTKHPVHLVHHLDQPVSGAILFAATTSAMRKLTDQLVDGKVRKGYLVVIEKGLSPENGKLEDYLVHRKDLKKAFVGTSDDKSAKRAVLHYQKLNSSEHFDLLFIQIDTGRFHQIRCQLSNTGFPVRGDDKYGYKRSNKDRSIDLHSWVIEFIHPTKNQNVKVFAPLPDRPIWNVFGSANPEFPGWKNASDEQ